jgi:hypothetical protein
MSVEIKELVIRAVIGKGTGEARDEEAGGSDAAPLGEPGLTDEIVQVCVRQVMHILARNKER